MVATLDELCTVIRTPRTPNATELSATARRLMWEVLQPSTVRTWIMVLDGMHLLGTPIESATELPQRRARYLSCPITQPITIWSVAYVEALNVGVTT